MGFTDAELAQALPSSASAPPPLHEFRVDFESFPSITSRRHAAVLNAYPLEERSIPAGAGGPHRDAAA